MAEFKKIVSVSLTAVFIYFVTDVKNLNKAPWLCFLIQGALSYLKKCLNVFERHLNEFERGLI